MARMGDYCRAYYARDFAAFPGWRLDAAQLRSPTAEADGREGEVGRGVIHDERVLYLQEDFRVTDGIFLDENVVFADAGPEWRTFCSSVLGFAPMGAEPSPADT